MYEELDALPKRDERKRDTDPEQNGIFRHETKSPPNFPPRISTLKLGGQLTSHRSRRGRENSDKFRWVTDLIFFKHFVLVNIVHTFSHSSLGKWGTYYKHSDQEIRNDEKVIKVLIFIFSCSLIIMELPRKCTHTQVSISPVLCPPPPSPHEIYLRRRRVDAMTRHKKRD